MLYEKYSSSLTITTDVFAKTQIDRYLSEKPKEAEKSEEEVTKDGETISPGGDK